MSLFDKKSIGVNIADRTIEVAEITRDENKIKILNLSRVHLDVGVIENGKIKDKEKLKKYFKELFDKAKPQAIKAKEIIFGLPENQSYVHIFTLNSANKDSRDNLVLKEAQTIIPIESKKLIFDYKTLHEDKDSAEILLVASDSEYVIKWKMFFEEIGIKINIFDIGNFASFRNLFAEDPKEPICVVNVGEFITNIDIFDNVGLCYSYTTHIAGNYFTTELASGLGITEEEAETMKTQFGLTVTDKKAFAILEQSIQVLVNDIKESISFFEEKNHQPIKEIIFIGGSSKMKGIVSFTKTTTGLKASRGEISSQFKGKVPVEYMGAVGLALRGIDKKWDKRDPAITISNEDFKNRLNDNKIKKEYASSNGLFLKNESLDDKKIKRTRNKKILLVIILIIGLIGLTVAFLYRAKTRALRATDVKVELKYNQKQTFNFTIPVSLAGDNKDAVRGTIIEDIVSGYDNENDAINFSKNKNEEKISGNNNIILVSIVLNPENNNFIIEWLSYPKEVANSFFIKEINKLNTTNISYIIDSIKIDKVEKQDDPSLYLLSGEIIISLDTLIEIEVAKEEIITESNISTTEDTTKETNILETVATEQEIVAEEIKYITIKPTETGWLNTRSGPGTSYAIVTKIYPGDKYELIKTDNGWSNIKLADGSLVWISSQYTE